MIDGVLVDAEGSVLLSQVARTSNAWDRMRGLLWRPPLADGSGLWIEPCASVHTAGMAYPLDLAFIGRDGRVVKLLEAVPPWRLAASGAARATLEMAGDGARACGLARGMQVFWKAR